MGKRGKGLFNKSATFLLMLIGLMSIAYAAHIMLTNTGQTSWSFNEDLASAVYNFSVNNTDGGIALIANVTDVNVTIPSTFSLRNATNGTTGLGTFIVNAGSTVLTWRNVSLGGIVNGSNGSSAAGANAFKYFWFNASASTPGIYNITVSTFGSNSTALVYTNTNLTVRVNDTERPAVENSNISGPVATNNWSGTIRLNVSVHDNSLISAVVFNVSNASGHVASIYASNPETTTWNATFSTSTLADGSYNVTVFANDTYGWANFTDSVYGGTHFAGNLNNTARVQVIFDNTAPTMSASCTPTSVEVGATVTCSCSGSDATTNVNETSITANPDTSQTGTFVVECWGRDTAGNRGTGSAQYTVTGSGGGSSGGSGGGGGGGSTTWTTTYPVNDEELASGVTRTLSSKKRISFTVAGETHYVGVQSISGEDVTIVVSSEPQTVTMKAGETKKFEVSGDNYYDIKVTLNSVNGGNAEITTVAIHEEVPQELPGEEEEVGETPSEEETSSSMWIIIVVVVIIVIILIYFFSRKRR